MHADLQRAVLKDVLNSAKGECLFIQETKMEVIDDVVLRSLCSFCDPDFAFAHLMGDQVVFF